MLNPDKHAAIVSWEQRVLGLSPHSESLMCLWVRMIVFQHAVLSQLFRFDNVIALSSLVFLEKVQKCDVSSTDNGANDLSVI